MILHWNESCQRNGSQEEISLRNIVDSLNRGNMNTTLIRTNNKKASCCSMMVSSLRPYSRIHLVSGTKGVAQKWPGPERIGLCHSWIKKETLMICIKNIHRLS
jgi:hypothetical protein